MPSILDRPYFRDEAAAYAKVESIVWPNGPVCVHCGETNRIGLLKGNATRPGIYKCYRCRKQFRVTVGTIFEASHIALHHWLQAIYLMVSSKKGVSSNQLHRTMGITLKSAWFMSHRIREATGASMAKVELPASRGSDAFDQVVKKITDSVRAQRNQAKKDRSTRLQDAPAQRPAKE